MSRHPLAIMLDAYQWRSGIEGKTLAAEIGLSESSLTRIKQGRLPDAHGLAKIVAWMVGIPLATEQANDG